METKTKKKTSKKTVQKKETKTNTKKKTEKPSVKKTTKKIDIKKEINKTNYILLVIASIFMVIVLVKLLVGTNEKIIINQSVDIEIGGYNQVAMVNYFIDNVSIQDNKYMVVNIDILNRKDIDSNTSYHQFYLVDINGNEIGPCYHAGMINDIDFTDIYPDVIKANSHTVGNLYCPTLDRYIKQFKIKVISGGTIDKNNKVNYEYSDYYVDLKD